MKGILIVVLVLGISWLAIDFYYKTVEIDFRRIEAINTLRVSELKIRASQLILEQRELQRLQDEYHFLYQVCVDQAREYGVSASDCFNIAVK